MSPRTTTGENALAATISRRITDRDRTICHALYEHRVLTAKQIHELHFGTLDRTRERLAQLTQLGVVERFRPYRQYGSHPYHYLLGRHGAELLASDRGIDVAQLDYSHAKTLRLASSQQLHHQVETNGIVTRLAQALRLGRAGTLLDWHGQRRCTQRWGEVVRPDALLRLALRGTRLDLWLEHDRSTEPHARLREKLDRYAELALAIERPITLLLTLTGDRRERKVHRSLHPVADVLALTTTTERHHAGPLGANWLALGAERRIELSELADRSAWTNVGEQ